MKPVNVKKTIYVLILFSYSCSTKLDLDIPKIPPKIVLTGFITNDSIINIEISKTSPMYENNFEKVKDANVKLYGNNQFIENLSKTGSGKYSSSVTAQTGITYTIYADITGFDRLSASTYIPEKPIINYAKLYPDFYFDQQQLQYASKAEIIFNDNQNSENFYQISFYGFQYKGLLWDGNTESYIITDSTHVNFFGVQYLNSEDPIILNEDDINYYSDKGDIRSFVFSDELLNRNNSLNVYVRGINTDSSGESVCVLRGISYDYYKFQKSWIRQSFNQGLGSFNPSNMFLVKNPNDLYSNVKNGLGIFAGYSESEMIMEKAE